MCKEAQIFERLSIKINYYLLNGIHSRNMLTKKKLMKGVTKVISILVRIIIITRMKLLMLPKAKKPNHFACKMGLQTSFIYKVTCCVRSFICPTTFREHFLWRNQSQRFFMAEPVTETMTTGYQRPRSWDPSPESQMQQPSYTIAPTPKMARITNLVITHRSSGLTNGGELN